MTQEELNKRAKEAVMAYNAEGAKAVAKDAIASGADLADLIQSGFTVGIKEVGRLFEEKKLFLPHIMAAAAAMNSGVDILTPEITKIGKSADEGLGGFVICSIEGDIHSIGKDIVAIMLKVAGFNVVNIGRDVPLGDIVKACKDNNAKYVGTSALMTSTMVNQKTFEELLKKEGIRDKLITNVGGAPVTQEWADSIGADVYSENATDAVAKMTKIAG
ncbi:MAG: corrinoid protein [Methanomassiliicoccaceae archaeon]|nr:corrinoid protein [Methanomassiliicoccaceae archaeon]